GWLVVALVLAGPRAGGSLGGRRRQDVERGAVSERVGWGLRLGGLAVQSPSAVWRVLAGAALSLEARVWRSRWLAVQVHGRRRALDRDHAQPRLAGWSVGQHRSRHITGQAVPRLGADRGRPGRRVSLR